MPAKKKHPLYAHELIRPLMEASATINSRRKGLPKGAPLPVTAAEDLVLRSSSALMRLIAHTAKLEQAVHFLRQKGRTNLRGPTAVQLLCPAGWVEYHLGYFFALHRSTSDTAQWFVQEVLDLKLPRNLGAGEKFRTEIAKAPALFAAFNELHNECGKFVNPRNDHLHRGQYVRSKPVIGRDDYDQLLVADTLMSLLRKASHEHYSAVDHKLVRDKIARWRQALVAALEVTVDDLHQRLALLLDVLVPVLMAQIKMAAEQSKRDMGPGKGAMG